MWWLLTVFIIQLISIFLYLVLGYRVHTRWAPEVYTLNISIVIHRMACKHTIKIRYYLFHTYQILNPLLREAVIHLFLPWQFVLFVSTITIHFFIQIVIFFTICYGFLFNSKILFFSFPVQMYIRSLLFTATIMWKNKICPNYLIFVKCVIFADCCFGVFVILLISDYICTVIQQRSPQVLACGERCCWSFMLTSVL